MSYNKGKLIIFSAPSGAGKTTLVRYALSQLHNLEFSVSCTTRKKREGEIEGKDYYFLSLEDFKKKIENEEFLEFEEVYPNHFYGTLHSEIQRIWSQNKHVVFDIDVEGGLHIKKKHPEALAIFISVSNIKTLEERLYNRKTEDKKTMEMRMEKAEKETAYSQSFDLSILNDNLEEAKKNVIKTIKNFINE